jgi:hypothetical protein
MSKKEEEEMMREKSMSPHFWCPFFIYGKSKRGESGF